MSLVEIGIEDPDSGDAFDGQVVALGGSPDRLRIRTVVNAERLLPVVTHVRVDPGHADLGIALHDSQARRCAVVVDGNRQAVGKETLDQVSRHAWLLELVGIDRIRRLQWAMARNTGTSGSLPRLARAIPTYSRRYYPVWNDGATQRCRSGCRGAPRP